MVTVEQFRVEVEELAARTPPPAAALAALDRALLPALSWGAISHPDATVRRLCLDYLDHLAVPESAQVFLTALTDPVPRVRRHAIHALTCEACKDQPLRADVLTPLRRVIVADPNPKVRYEALRTLLSRTDSEAGSAAIEDVVARGDRDLLAHAATARLRSVPAALRHRANQVLAS